MTEEDINSYKDHEISLLDIIVTLSGSWRLLVFGPFCVSVLAFSLSYMWPNSYESIALMRLNDSELSLLSTVPVQDRVIDELGLARDFNNSKDDARLYLSDKVNWKIDKKTGVATVKVSATTPERAMEINNAMINSLKIELLPKGKNKEKILMTIDANIKTLANNYDAIEQLKKQIGKQNQGDQAMEIVMKHYSFLMSEVLRKELENIDLEKSLDVKGEEIYIQFAETPRRKTSPKRFLVAIIAGVLSFSVILIFILIKEKISSLIALEYIQKRIIRIKDNLGMIKQ
jgi:ribosomal protein L14E/L6E/L27E